MDSDQGGTQCIAEGTVTHLIPDHQLVLALLKQGGGVTLDGDRFYLVTLGNTVNHLLILVTHHLAEYRMLPIQPGRG